MFLLAIERIKMKLYCLRTYDDLLGLRENFVIASSKEEAIYKKMNATSLMYGAGLNTIYMKLTVLNCFAF